MDFFSILLEAAATHDKAHDKQDDEHDEQYPCDIGCGTCHTGEAKNGGDQSNHEKSYSPTKHLTILLVCDGLQYQWSEVWQERCTAIKDYSLSCKSNVRRCGRFAFARRPIQG